ncbi:Rhamnogalacturonyl hydrolase YesR [Draconibacterium orientale]|uniref:Glycosyl hydrolase family 88 n=1 Tax=Draconibacterium orientale TaxID=1168034 RepID=X5DE08_9BACT|nr:glycoside hydrolase family 88 protein [Draconibacterium orientale]AHW58607.1 glycosyl hydrolase family 88 [Draconibacterium orientale]SET31400.1 Rhamnogalacturonyl hydrolase YesR [Draconibacterium orientale]
MKIKSLFFLLSLLILSVTISTAQLLPAKQEVIDKMTLTNAHLMKKWPDPGVNVITNKERTSNLWTRAVYYEGLMAFYSIKPDPAYLQYAIEWGEAHQWGLRDGLETRNADNQCAGQTYIDLYNIDQKPERIKDIKTSVDLMLKTEKTDDWNWIDALQMAMPVFAKLSVLTEDDKYSERMYKMYMDTKVTQGLYNKKDGLWWRDADFKPPYTEPNGEDCYWSRGNGWVVAALVRVMDILPEADPHYKEYLKTYKAMMKALLPLQREDGFWNASLHDPNNYGGKEATGTSLFVYGIAWGVNNGILSGKKYMQTITKGWNALASESVHENGFLGYVQGTGKEPKDGQPVSYTSKPDFEDYGLGCFLLAGSEVYKLCK